MRLLGWERMKRKLRVIQTKNNKNNIITLNTTKRIVRILRTEEKPAERTYENYKIYQRDEVGTCMYWGILVARKGNDGVIVRYINEFNKEVLGYFDLNRVEILSE